MDNKILKYFVFISFFCFINILLFSQTALTNRPLVDSSLPLTWTNGYTLILLQNSDIQSVNEAKDFVTNEGGRVAIFSNAHAMLGWVSPNLAEKIIGHHGIEELIFKPVEIETLKYQDPITRSLANYFNSVVSGEVDRQSEAMRFQGGPLNDSSQEHPYVDPQAVLNNLEDKYIRWDDELKNIEKNKGVFSGYSDTMLGTVAVCLFFVESDGSIDSNLYTWTTSARDQIIDSTLSGASFWVHQATIHNQNLAFYIWYYDAREWFMSQGYEPILHRVSDDSLWINPIMSNIGFSSGTKVDRVTAFNAWFKNFANSNWAYSCFIAYNPPGSASAFTDGYFANAYYGGPYMHMLYRNNGWSANDNWRIFSHSTGHIFWACHEQTGSGGCTSCLPCNSYRPITNGNCEHPSCNTNSVPCIMKDNSNALCSFTAAQVGWPGYLLTIQAGTGGTTNPVPGSNYYDPGTTVQVTAVPDANYEFVNWTGDISSTQNPVTVTMNDHKTIKANFRVKPKLTIQSNEFGTTNPSPGVYYYAPGTQVQISPIPKTYCIFISWSGDATGSNDPLVVTMDRDKTVSAYFRYIYGPIATGQKVLNRTFSQAEYINILTWQADPANAGLDITKYRIYTMSGNTPTLLVELAGDKIEYYHRQAGQASIQYAVRAVTSSGREGAPALVTVQ